MATVLSAACMLWRAAPLSSALSAGVLEKEAPPAHVGEIARHIRRGLAPAIPDDSIAAAMKVSRWQASGAGSARP
jgi:hypothetical protein